MKAASRSWRLSLIDSPLQQRTGYLRQPRSRRGIDQRRQRLAHARMILIEPGDLVRLEQRWLDGLAIDRREGDGLEAIDLAARLAQPVAFLDNDEILDADAVGAGLVIAWLVRDDHARHQRLAVRQLRDALRPFMDAEIGADAVAGAVIV